ncbi:C40 family peptidase [Streptomyces californicus]
MASHRKPRTKLRSTTPAIGLTTAALASVTLLSTQNATAAPAEPKPAIEEVRKKVDDLYRQAGVATQEYNRAKAASGAQQKKVDALLSDVAKRTEKINEARRALGYLRGGTVPRRRHRAHGDVLPGGEPAGVLRPEPDDGPGDGAAAEGRERVPYAAGVGGEEARGGREEPGGLTETQATLASSKKDVQSKLSEARRLLSRLTAEEKARLRAEPERKQGGRGQGEGGELAARQAAEAKERAAAEEKAREEAGKGSGGGTGTGAWLRYGDGRRLRFRLRAAATPPRPRKARPSPAPRWGSRTSGAPPAPPLDCSGLTQAAWQAAGVTLPRTTWTRSTPARASRVRTEPGDLVFFYADISHVGLYNGGG